MMRAHRTAPTGTLRSSRSLLPLTLLVASAGGVESSRSEDPPKVVLKSETFDQNPGWESFNNRLRPMVIPTITQDFGYSSTNTAGEGKGELGGRIFRNATPSYYADKIAIKTLNDTLAASGTFAITSATAGGGVFFGWFNAKQPSGGGRPMNSLGLNLDGETKGGRLAVRLLTGTNQGTGTFVTPYEQYRKPELRAEKRPTPLKPGTRYAWALNYDPEANRGQGRFQFRIQGDGDKSEAWEGKVFTVDLPPGYKKDGATFDHFGLMNMTKPGGAMTIHFDDLGYDGKTEDFVKDPDWVGSNNRATLAAVPVGSHDFGFSAETTFAGGAAGELGGDLWRSGKYGYYADEVGPLTLEDRLEARGKVVLAVGAPDADMHIGWFNRAVRDRSPIEAGHFLGVQVGGPTRVGHYFNPSLSTAKGTRGKVDAGPVLVPGKTFDWSLVYDPTANSGKGEIQVTLGKESVTLPLKGGVKAQGASFDRFGLFTSTAGGQLVRIFLDDLKYTAARPAR